MWSLNMAIEVSFPQHNDVFKWVWPQSCNHCPRHFEFVSGLCADPLLKMYSILCVSSCLAKTQARSCRLPPFRSLQKCASSLHLVWICFCHCIYSLCHLCLLTSLSGKGSPCSCLCFCPSLLGSVPPLILPFAITWGFLCSPVPSLHFPLPFFPPVPGVVFFFDTNECKSPLRQVGFSSILFVCRFF